MRQRVLCFAEFPSHESVYPSVTPISIQMSKREIVDIFIFPLIFAYDMCADLEIALLFYMALRNLIQPNFETGGFWGVVRYLTKGIW